MYIENRKQNGYNLTNQNKNEANIKWYFCLYYAKRMWESVQNKIYYETQIDWDAKDFYYLHRCLHRLFYYYKKYSEEISKMNLDKMSEETKVLIYCIIKYYNYDFIFDDYSNLSTLRDTKPLKNKLVLDDNVLPEENIYKEMNVMY